MQFLSELRYAWASVQLQHETLQDISHAHGELVKVLARSSMRYAPGFHGEDFFNRYSNIGGTGGPSFGFDAANLRLADVAVDTGAGPTADGTLRNNDVQQRPNLKRKNTAPPGPIINRRRPDVEVIWSLAPSALGLSTLGPAQQSFSYTSGEMPHSSPGLLATPTSVPIHHESQEMCTMNDHMVGDASANNAAVVAAAAAGFTMSPTSHAFPSHHMHSMGGAPFSPPYSYGSGSSITNAGPGMINEASGGYDAVFGTVPTNALGSPAAWHGGDRHNKMQLNQVRPGAASPSARSNNGSTGTGQGERKDPFLSRPGQLAENENEL